MVAADLFIHVTGCSFPVLAFTEHTRVYIVKVQKTEYHSVRAHRRNNAFERGDTFLSAEHIEKRENDSFRRDKLITGKRRFESISDVGNPQ